MILETERLVLRPIEATDWRALFPLMSDPVVMAHWDSTEIDDPDIVQQMLVAEKEDMEAGVAYYWAIERALDRAFLGSCDLSEIDQRHRRGEVGFMLDPTAWGQGYGIEAMRAVVHRAAAIGLRRLWARAHVGNDRSERLLRNLGFEEEGYLRGHIQRDGERRDCKIFGLLL